MKKIRACLAAALAVASMGLSAMDTIGIWVNGHQVGHGYLGAAGGGNWGWDYKDDVIELNSSTNITYYLTGSNTVDKVGIKVTAPKCTIIAEDLVLTIPDYTESGAIYLVGNVECDFRFKGDCVLRGGDFYAGLEVQEEASITITNIGKATLKAYGGYAGAGIGGASEKRHSGAITINCDDEGTIEAYGYRFGGSAGAGIGGGMKYDPEVWLDNKPGYRVEAYYGGDCESIVINGGNIYAHGFNGSAGIGGGFGSWMKLDGTTYLDHLGGNVNKIIINGGHVTAVGSCNTGGGQSPGIGSGYGAKEGGDIMIYGGTVKAWTDLSGSKLKLQYCSSIGDGNRTKNGGRTWINGGTFDLPSLEELEDSVKPVRDPKNNAGVPVYLCRCQGFTPGAKVEIDGIWVRGTRILVQYGLNDLYADDAGRLNFYLPEGEYEFEAAGRHYEMEIGSTQEEVLAETFVNIYFNPGDGVFSDGSTEKTMRCLQGGSVGTLPVATRTNYTLLGWKDMNGEYVSPATVFTESVTLWADWGYNYVPKAVIDNQDGVQILTFVYDGVDYAALGKPVFLMSDAAALSPSADPLWHDYKDSITEVVITPTFARYAPKHCGHWFDGFTNLASIEGLEYLDTSAATDLQSMFSGCFVLNELDVSHFNTSSVTNMTDMFHNCYQVTELDVSGFDTSKVRNMSSMFNSCQKLTQLDLSNFDVKNVSDFSSMFKFCSKLTRLDLTSFVLGSARNTASMFYGCTNLKAIYATNMFGTLGVSSSANMFTRCVALKGEKGTTCNTQQPVDKTYARIDQGSDQPGYFSRLPVVLAQLGGQTLRFQLGSELATQRPSGVRGEDWFPVTDAEDNPDQRPAWCRRWSEECTKVVIAPSFAEYRPSTCAGWFDGLEHVTAIKGLENLDVSQATSLKEMFARCRALKELDLNSFVTTNVQYMAEMFRSCESLKTIRSDVPFATDRLTDDGEDMFYGCWELVGGSGFAWASNPTFRSAEYARPDYGTYGGEHWSDYQRTFGYFTRSPVAVVYCCSGDMKFYYDSCYHRDEDFGYTFVLDEADGTGNPPWYGHLENTRQVTFDPSFAGYRPASCHAWFKDAGYLSAFLGMSYLDVGAAQDLSEMFAGCTALKTLDLSHFDTLNVENMTDMFAGCSQLERIGASEMFNTQFVQGTQSMFSGCTSLVGGGGFAYDATKVDQTYARLGTASVEGYFSESAPMPMAVYHAANGTLTFYFDQDEHEGEGEVYSLLNLNATGNRPWSGICANVTEVVFDPSFADYRPPSCYRWFYNFENLTKLTGLNYLNVSETTSFQQTFANCLSLTELDLTSFDTRNVTTMANMFYKCGLLETIYVSSTFTTASLANPSENVFDTNAKLKGGMGTAFDQSKRAATYARIDGGTDAPGYFTAKDFAAVAVRAEDGQTLTFYYDSLDHAAEGTVYAIDAAADPAAMPPWNEFVEQRVTTVAFDPSFALYRPAHCGNWFSGFLVLEAVEGLENLNLSEATSLRGMFASCQSLKGLDLSGFKTASVRDMSEMFVGCQALDAIDVSAFDTASVTNMARMFANTVMTELDLYGFDTAEVADMAGMFAGNASLRSIYVSERFTAAQAAEANVFGQNDALKGGAGTAFDGANVGKAYARVDAPGAPGYLTMKRTAKAVLSEGGYWLRFYYDDLTHAGEGTVFPVNEKLVNADVPVRDAAWLNQAQPTVGRVVIDSSFADFRPTCCAFWFYNIRGLQYIEGIEYLNVSEATNLRYMFGGCEHLTDIDVSSFDTRKVTDMQNMFWNCTKLRTIFASELFVTTALEWPEEGLFGHDGYLQGGLGTQYVEGNDSAAVYARIDGGTDAPGYFTYKAAPAGGYAAWAAEKGLTGADAAWDAKPALWDGKWENAFIYTYGEGLAGGTLAIMDISFDVNGKPVITTTPVVKGHDDFTPAVIGAPTLDNWSSPVTLENKSGNDWTLPAGKSANFFRVRLSE